MYKIKLPVIIIALIALFCGLNIRSAQATPTLTVNVVNHSSVPNFVVADALPAFQEALDKDLNPIWGTDATLILNGSGEGWTIELLDFLGCNCYGFHIMSDGKPYAAVQMHESTWQLFFTHELFETMVDPYGDRASFTWMCYS